MISREKAIRLREIIELAMNAAKLEDSVAIEGTPLFAVWKVDVHYMVGDRVQYKDVLYKVLTEHTSQETWTPDASPSLFAKVLIPDENVIPEWEQPDSTNPYMKGDKVIHNDKTWVSNTDNNVWEPGVYGWDVAE